jgi:uncharacterized protein involved in outer membrane biogenesis
VTNAFGLENAPNIAFSGSATVERIAAGVRIEDGVVNIGDDRLSMSGTVGNRPLSSETAIDFDARVANLPGTLGDFAIDAARLPATRFRLAGALSAEATTSAGARLILTDGTASYAGLEATMAGNFALPGILEDSRLRFRASGDDLQAVLPANDLFRALDKPFNAEGTLTISSGNVSIPDFRFGIDQSRLTADLRAALDPAMTALRAKVDVVSPNLYALSPYFADKSLPGTVAPFELHSDLSLEDGLLTVDVLRATIGAGLLDISGTATGPPAFDGTDLRIDLQLADMRRLNVLLGQELPELPASLTLHLIGNANVARLEEFAASIGDSDFAGEFEIRSGEIPEISFLLSSERLDVTPFLPPAETASPVPAAGSKPVARSADRVIPDTDIPFERLQGVKATANLKVAEIVAGPKRIRDFAIEAVLADGALGVNRFALRTGQDGELSGRLHIDPLADGARVGMRLRGTNLRFGLPALTAEELAQVPRYDLSVAFLTSGRNLRELASVLNGYLKMTVGPGRIRATAMRIFTNDFLSQLLNTVNPFVKNDPYTNLKCSAILLAIENGQLVGDPALVAQSDRINIHSKVKIDLRTEKLEADINTVPTKGLGLSLSNLVNPYVMVGGTLAAPVIGLDPESTLIEGGAAVATGGLSILAKGLKDRFFSDRDPCGTAVANADEKFAELERKYAKHPAIDQ